MPLKNIFGSGEDNKNFEEDEYVELDASGEETNQKVKIRVATLNEFGDVDKVQSMLRDGNIVWVKMGPLKDKDMTDLKRAIDRIKKTVRSIDGDVAGIDDEWMVATPSYAHVHR
ncbi:MAG: cell division protein SepF [Candidatus Nanohaloarchaeota archaeon QJJ-9]|nr:cell division protein SepF [Candidatus Nanohaloarchaeota archaeon QJJ-9]